MTSACAVISWNGAMRSRRVRPGKPIITSGYCLRMVIQWGWDRRKYGITINHASRPGRLHNETRIDIVWNRERALHFYGSAPAHLRFPFMFAAQVWRQGDILTLDFSDFDGACFGKGRQAGSKKKVPFFAPCTRAMMAFIASHPTRTGPVFINASGKPWQSKSFQNEFAECARPLGADGLHFHDLRGTVQPVLGEAGLSDLQ